MFSAFYMLVLSSLTDQISLALHVKALGEYFKPSVTQNVYFLIPTIHLHSHSDNKKCPSHLYLGVNWDLIWKKKHLWIQDSKNFDEKLNGWILMPKKVTLCHFPSRYAEFQHNLRELSGIYMVTSLYWYWQMKCSTKYQLLNWI